MRRVILLDGLMTSPQHGYIIKIFTAHMEKKNRDAAVNKTEESPSLHTKNFHAASTFGKSKSLVLMFSATVDKRAIATIGRFIIIVNNMSPDSGFSNNLLQQLSTMCKCF